MHVGTDKRLITPHGRRHVEPELVAWVLGAVVGAARHPKRGSLAVDDGGLGPGAVDHGAGSGTQRGQRLVGGLLAAEAGLDLLGGGLYFSKGDCLGDDVLEELEIVLVRDGVGYAAEGKGQSVPSAGGLEARGWPRTNVLVLDVAPRFPF